jgi:hypothetical protein
VRIFMLVVVMCIVVVSGYVINQTSWQTLITAQGMATATPTVFPGPAQPIYSAPTALARSMSMFPAGFDVDESVVRSLTSIHASAWLQGPMVGVLATERAALIAEGTQESSFGNDRPNWLVGLKGEGLTVDDVIPMPGGVGDSSPVEGAFYLWDANSGSIISVGALDQMTWTNFDTLYSMSSDEFVITPMTPVITYIDATPNPSETLTANQQATNDALETTTAGTPTP